MSSRQQMIARSDGWTEVATGPTAATVSTVTFNGAGWPVHFWASRTEAGAPDASEWMHGLEVGKPTMFDLADGERLYIRATADTPLAITEGAV